MPEFRWILLALGLVLIIGIWWWGSRRSAQAPGNAELRELTPVTTFKEPEFMPEPRERSAPGFEPVNLHPAEFDRIPLVSEPIMVDIEPSEIREPGPRFVPPGDLPAHAAPGDMPDDDGPGEAADAAHGTTPPPAASTAPVPAAAPADAAPAEPAPEAVAPNSAHKQKIVSIRVCATGSTRWQGNSLLAAFELNGLAYGRYQVFHRRHVDGRSLFCVASMTEPGVFDVAKMQGQEFRGVTLFAVLPGPLEPLLTVDELLLAARDLAIALNGAVQDAKGAPMTAQRAAALRDEVARFQAALAVE